MSLPKVGDICFVQSECGCPESGGFLGMVFRVARIDQPADHRCGNCKRLYPASRAAYVNNFLCFKHEWLRKIDDLPADDETTEHRDDANSPAVPAGRKKLCTIR